MKTFTKKRFIQVVVILFSGFLIAQFIQPDLENPSIKNDMAMPADVKAVLQKGCFDCHSNETQLRWFDRISPASWMVANHIKNGRNAINFSEWNMLTTAQQKDKFWEMINLGVSGVMPPKEYTLMHPSTKLSESDWATLKNYISELVAPQTYDTLKTRQLSQQFNEWQKGARPTATPVANNGVAYDPDYKNWRAISSTDSYSNETIRIIFGNEIAVKAIKENKTLSWPNGSVLAKAQWDEVIDKDGNIHTGKFNQVEFMVKDDKKYAATEGWGWARFKTLQLIPDDKDALFETKCINCHRPVKNLDYVFTFPIR